MTKAKAQCPDGKIRTVKFTGLDHKGRPYEAGYRQGYVIRSREKVLGYVYWIMSGWRFIAYGSLEIKKYSPSVGRKSKFRPWETAEDYNTRHRT